MSAAPDNTGVGIVAGIFIVLGLMGVVVGVAYVQKVSAITRTALQLTI